VSSNDPHSGHGEHSHGTSRQGAKQPEVFDPSRAARLDDPARLEYLPPDRIFAVLDAPHGAIVVDFGTGTGTFAIELAQRRPDLTIIALDEQPGMIELLKAKLRAREFSNIRPLLTDKIDSIKGVADRVMAINVLHEVGDEPLRQIADLFKAGGYALIVDWDAAVDRPVGPPREHTHSAAEACDRLARAGFETERLESLPYHFIIRARPAYGSRSESKY
jgi:SAM-dependent methyltransferase